MESKQADQKAKTAAHAEAVRRGKLGSRVRWGGRERTRLCKLYESDAECFRAMPGKTLADKVRGLLGMVAKDLDAADASSTPAGAEGVRVVVEIRVG